LNDNAHFVSFAKLEQARLLIAWMAMNDLEVPNYAFFVFFSRRRKRYMIFAYCGIIQ